MKKGIFIFVVLGVLLIFNGICAAEFYDRDIESATARLNIKHVVYIEVTNNGSQDGFELDDIKKGWAVFEDIHTVEVSSTTDYIVAANINEMDISNSGYSDNYFLGHTIIPPYDDNYGTTSADFNELRKDYVWIKASEDCSSTIERVPFNGDGAATPQPPTYVTDPDYWHHIDRIGNYNFSLLGSKFEIIFAGNPTAGNDPGDVADIDLALDLKGACEEYEIPSGTYRFRINYLVLER